MRQSFVPITQQQRSLLERYREYGNERPPEEFLNFARSSLYGQRTPSFASRLLLADVFIDSAQIYPHGAHGRIVQAKGVLDEVIDSIEDLAADYPRAFRDQTPTLVGSYIRRAELPSWERAAKGRWPQPNYDRLLTAAGDIAGLAIGSGRAGARAIEFMPTLLGARGLTRGTAGWIGRQTLDREDHKRHGVSKSWNPNWDVGICTGNTGNSYLAPEIHIDTKSGDSCSDRVVDGHKQAGVVIMPAQTYGFNNPAQIIWSCILEADGKVPKGVNNNLLRPNQLDEIAGRIAEESASYTLYLNLEIHHPRTNNW